MVYGINSNVVSEENDNVLQGTYICLKDPLNTKGQRYS